MRLLVLRRRLQVDNHQLAARLDRAQRDVAGRRDLEARAEAQRQLRFAGMLFRRLELVIWQRILPAQRTLRISIFS